MVTWKWNIAYGSSQHIALPEESMSLWEIIGVFRKDDADLWFVICYLWLEFQLRHRCPVLALVLRAI